MNRPYTIEEFKEKINYIRSCIPDISISTDVIAGFVQESDEEFETTYKNLADLELSFFHVFPYSKRNGTKASTLRLPRLELLVYLNFRMLVEKRICSVLILFKS